MALTSKERAALRAAAHQLEPAVRVGAGGISAAVVQSLEEAFRTRELVKVHLGRNAEVEAREAAGVLARGVGAEVVQVIGHTTTLFRENPELRGKGRRGARIRRLTIVPAVRTRAQVQGGTCVSRRVVRQPHAEGWRYRPGQGRPRAGTAETSDKRAAGELAGQLAESHAEIERLKKMLYESEAENAQRRAKRARPDMLRGTTRRMETPLGTMYVTITEDDRGQPFEVFITLGKAGGAAMADVEAMGRMISLALRSGIPIMEVHKQLRGIASDRPIGLGPNKVLSVPDAIGIAIEQWWREKQGVQQELLGGAVGFRCWICGWGAGAGADHGWGEDRDTGGRAARRAGAAGVRRGDG